MSGDRIFLIEMVLVFGLVLAWAVWELTSLRRSQTRDRAKEKREVHHGEHSEGTESTTGPGPQILP